MNEVLAQVLMENAALKDRIAKLEHALSAALDVIIEDALRDRVAVRKSHARESGPVRSRASGLSRIRSAVDRPAHRHDLSTTEVDQKKEEKEKA